jgi:hypothetical protein
MASVMHSTPNAPQPPATPAPAPPNSPAPALAGGSGAQQPALYFGDRIAMTVWFWCATVLACLLLVKELAAVLLPQ